MNIPAFNKSTAALTAAAIADRGLLGVATLLTTVLIGRWAGPEELGLFSLFFPVAFAAIALQESLITAPYTVFAAECAGAEDRRAYLGSVLVHTGALAAALGGVFAVAALALWLAGHPAYAAAAGVLAPVAPCVLLREFARRVVYADLNPQIAVAVSGGASVLQLIAMAALHAGGRLSAVSAFVAIGASSLLVGAAWTVLSGKRITVRRDLVKGHFSRNLHMGRWIAAAQVGDVVRIHMFPWLLALALDESSVGVYAACAAIAGLSGPLQIAISSILLPKFALVEARGGMGAADRLMWQATGWMVAAMALFTLAIGSVSGQVVPFLYGAAYLGAQTPLVLLLMAQLVIGVSMPAARALVALRRPDLDFITHMAGIGANLFLGAPLVLLQGVEGAAAAALIGAAVKAALTAAFYSRELRGGRLGSAAAEVQAVSLPVAPLPATAVIGAPRGSYAAATTSHNWAEDRS
ncbi:MAG: hypothetical protein DCC67_03950 [Planctomycetota bacterium]|nr:MAG: hypothetical protein DCC67_03950 [Planctomycetota bacterium]